MVVDSRAEMRASADAMCVGEMKEAMRNWVTCNDDMRHHNQAEGLIRMDIRHNLLEQRWHDLRFCLDSTIFTVKEQLHKHGAGAVGHMELFLRRNAFEDTIFLYDDNKTLRSYGADNDMELFVKDNDPYSLARNGGLEDVSQIEKYKISEEAYDKREKTVRRYVKEQKENNPDFKPFKMTGQGGSAGAAASNGGGEPLPEIDESPETLEQMKKDYTIGARCECNPGGRRGTVKFVGKVKKMKGFFVGIELDEPQGLNDGTKDGERIFECKGDKYGVFARVENVQVGDFPELDPFADLDLDDEDEI